MDLDFDQIKAYVHLELSSGPTRFFEETDRNYLGQLLKIPFYLATLVKVFHDTNSLPESRASIFEQLLQARIKFDEDHFRTTIELDEYQYTIIKTLERIALGMETLGRNYVSDHEFKELVPDLALRNLVRHCTAFRKTEGEHVMWQFEHNSIQEYLAARVLSRMPLETIKDFVSFKPEHRKIIPSWVNTVAFLLSASEEASLLDWILEVEPEMAFKFEPDKTTKPERSRIFRSIFDRYREKQIWINRDRFRSDELARFGQFEEIIDFLLTEAENATHHTALGNAIAILNEMLIPPDYKERTRGLLERVALASHSIDANESIQCRALMALSNLRFNSRDVVERVVSALRGSTSDWVRYGLYYFLHNSDFLDDFIGVFIDGIQYASVDFSSGGLSRLGNERWELKQGLKKVQSPNSVRRLLEYFVKNESDLHDLFVGDHDISFIGEIATKAFSEDPSFLDCAVNFSLFMLNNHHNEEAGQFLSFYERTNTKLDAFKNVLGTKGQYNEYLLADLADKQCIDYFIEQLEEANISDDEMWAFLQTLRWKNKELFEPFYSKVNKTFENKFVLKPLPDWKKQEKERRQRDIELMFDKRGLLREIRLVFETEGKETITRKELSRLRSKYWPDLYYSDLAYDTLRRIAGGQEVTMEMATEAINKWDWDWFRISRIYESVRTYEELELSQDHKKWIADWCHAKLDNVDFRTAIQKTDNRSFSVRWDAIYAWFFFRTFDLQYPTHILLDMLSFDHNRDGIEYLENHLEEAEMTSRILDNLKEGIIIDDVLKNHIDFCKRHRVKEAIIYALKEIANVEREPYDEIRRISLEAISDLSEDLSELENILPDVKDAFKWDIVDQLMERNSEVVHAFLEDQFQKGVDEDRIKASEYLIKLQDHTALRFYVDWIKEQGRFPRSLFDSSPLTSLKTSKAVPVLIELLELSYHENFKQADMFERLDRLVLDSLTAIALESAENYLDVKESIENFIKEYSATYMNVNWLHAFLDQLEQKYYIHKTEQIEIEDVISKLEEIDV